jgi:serine-type D-Ala-D-Ala carboxypeptidase/endopeptidase (penicillin-binding protein 4)
MQHADTVWVDTAGWKRHAPGAVVARLALSSCCILHFALAVACARTPPATIPAPPAATAATSIGGAGALSTLPSDILAATRLPGVQRGTWGVVVQSLDRNERLFELNPRTLLVPASVAKLVSLATAVDAVGWDYTWETRLSTAAGTEISNGVLRGDLIVNGAGDPAIGGRGGDDLSVLVNAIKAAGITRVQGRIIGDDDAIEEPRPAFAWAWDDLGYPTGALFGALNFAENRTTVGIEPGSERGKPGTLVTDSMYPDRPLINRTSTGAPGSPQQLWPEQRPGDVALSIAGTIPVGAAPARLGVSAGNPTLWFANALRTRLVAVGIDVTGAAVDQDDVDRPIEETTLFTYRSHRLADIAVPMLKESINLYAEAAMRLNAARGNGPLTNDAALEGFNARLQSWGIPRDGFQIVDGSGLSRRDVLAPETLLTVLQRMYDPAGTSPWMRALPIAGVDGSLETRMRGTPAERNVRAKTGTMSNIRSLAGYVTTADGEHLAFAILLNDFEGTGAQALQAIDTIAVRLATFRR